MVGISHSHFPFSSLLLITISFMIINIDSSYGEDEPLRGKDLVIQVCNQTSDTKFCIDSLLSSAPSPPATAGEVANVALRLAQGKATEARILIASLLISNSSSSAQDRWLLQRCQLDNNKAIRELLAANNDLNSDSFDSMVDDLNTATNATKSYRDIIQGISPFSALANMSNDVIKLCEICVVSTKFFSIDDWN